MGTRQDTSPGVRAGRLVKRATVLGAALCLLLEAAGPLWAQDSPVPVRLSDTEVPAGGQFTLTFDVTPASADTLTVTEPTYPSSLQKDGGPLIRPAIAGADAAAVNGRQTVEVQLSFTALRAGRYIIGSFQCQDQGRTYTTEPVVISVTDPANGNIVPPSARWVVSVPEPYQGQTVFMELVLDNLTEPLFPDRITTTPPATGVFEEVRGLGKISSRRVGSTVLYQVPIATFYLTPTADGSLTVPAATISVKGVRVRAPSLDLSVKKLPPSVQSSGAVGSLSFTATIANPEIAEGDSFDLTMRVEGTGNLAYLHFPDITSKELVVTPTGERNRYVPTETGYTGYREVSYQLTPRTPGTVKLSVPGLVWMDPGSGEIQQSGTEVLSLKTDPAPITASAAQSPSGAAVFALLSVVQVRQMDTVSAYRNPLNYLWLLPGVMVLVVIVLLRRGGKKPGVVPFVAGLIFFVSATAPQHQFPAKEVQAGIDAFQAGKVSVAIDQFRSALSVRPHNPGILYNQSLCYFQAHRYGEAIYYLNNAIRFDPTNRVMRQTLAWMEQRLSLTRQIEPPWSVNPDLMLIIVAILFNLTCVLLAISGAGKGGRYVIVLVFAVLLTLAAGGGLVYSISTQNDEIGVVGRDAGNLLKIPRPDATSWLELPRGTTVRILLDSNNFYLVRTGYGVEGWLPAEDVLYQVLPVGVPK